MTLGTNRAKLHNIMVSVEERFWSKVDKSEGPDACWIWLAFLAPAGYGKFTAQKGRCVLAHRFAWELTNGEIPGGLYACHKCDVRSCVNPSHIFLGTARDNARDTSAKGRCNAIAGEDHWRFKLSPDQIWEIKALWTLGERQSAIAKRFDVTQPTVNNICRGRGRYKKVLSLT